MQGRGDWKKGWWWWGGGGGRGGGREGGERMEWVGVGRVGGEGGGGSGGGWGGGGGGGGGDERKSGEDGRMREGGQVETDFSPLTQTHTHTHADRPHRYTQADDTRTHTGR